MWQHAVVLHSEEEPGTYAVHLMNNLGSEWRGPVSKTVVRIHAAPETANAVVLATGINVMEIDSSTECPDDAHWRQLALQGLEWADVLVAHQETTHMCSSSAGSSQLQLPVASVDDNATVVQANRGITLLRPPAKRPRSKGKDKWVQIERIDDAREGCQIQCLLDSNLLPYAVPAKKYWVDVTGCEYYRNAERGIRGFYIVAADSLMKKRSTDNPIFVAMANVFAARKHLETFEDVV